MFGTEEEAKLVVQQHVTHPLRLCNVLKGWYKDKRQNRVNRVVLHGGS